MVSKKQIKSEELCWLTNHTYPFYFKRINENGKPVVYGDFSSGMIGGIEAYIESEVEWEDVIYPIPNNKNMIKTKSIAKKGKVEVFVLFNGNVYKMPKEVTSGYEDYLEGRVMSTSPSAWISQIATDVATYLRKIINTEIQGCFHFCNNKGRKTEEQGWSARRYWASDGKP